MDSRPARRSKRIQRPRKFRLSCAPRAMTWMRGSRACGWELAISWRSQSRAGHFPPASAPSWKSSRPDAKPPRRSAESRAAARINRGHAVEFLHRLIARCAHVRLQILRKDEKEEFAMNGEAGTQNKPIAA